MSQLSSAYRESIILHNNKVEKNRHILKRIISCVKFCSAFDLALRGHDESEFSENQGIFKELINFTAELDNTLKEHLRTATVFKGTSNTIQNEILESMLQVCREEICKQIEKADYLSVQCDETTDVSNYLRYFNEGSICEHFWGFIRIKDKTATGLKTCIENEIDPLVLKTPQKLIAQTYDGANVMLSKSRLKTELEIIYSREDLKEIVGAMNLLSFILENNLNETFIETSKILKIIVTTPMTTAEAERTFSTLKRIKTFLRNTMLNDRLNALVMISINRNLVHQINNFDDKVMEKFISMKDRRADFNFKK
nr:unnamed protein product [Callosobruchus chinensis]